MRELQEVALIIICVYSSFLLGFMISDLMSEEKRDE